MTRRDKVTVALWLAILALAAWIVLGHTRIHTDLTGFLPKVPDRTQQLLLDQLREGPASRLLLIGIEGGSVERMARISIALADKLRHDPHIAFVHNGELTAVSTERDLLMRFRYLLSPAVTPEHFSAPALKTSLEASAAMLSSQAGAVVRQLIPQDPTGEVIRVLKLWTPAAQVTSREGVWFANDGTRALLVAQTRASGLDIDQQRAAIAAIQGHFAEALRANPVGADKDDARLLLSGTGVFASTSRNAIEQDSWRLSLVATGLVLCVLLLAYRSIGLTLLAFVPVMAGLLVGVAAVSLWFGGVHGITLAFGATLIGEAVDYPNYAFLHTRRGEPVRHALERIGPTLRLAILSTVFSAIAMLLSSFEGLAQLGMLSFVSVAVAGLTTRYVLPTVGGESLTRHKLEHLPFSIRPGHRIGILVLPFALAAVTGLALQYQDLWENDLASLSPVTEDAKRLDQQLRSQLGAPDMRYLLVVTGADAEHVLRNSERVRPDLDALVKDGAIGGYDMAASYLPSLTLQQQRQAALPPTADLQRALQQALADLPFRDDAFQPFIDAVNAAKTQAPMTLADLKDSSIGLKVQSLLLSDREGAVALVTLSGVRDNAAFRQALLQLKSKGITGIDLKDDTASLITRYRDEALLLSALGVTLIALLLWFSLRSLRAMLAVMYPVLAATAICAAMTVFALGERLTLFHLVSLLLVVGIGLNYALFFNRPQGDAADSARNYLALVTCSLTTFLSFGTLMLSRLPVLHAIGQTVALGAVLSMLCAFLLARPGRAEKDR